MNLNPVAKQLKFVMAEVQVCTNGENPKAVVYEGAEARCENLITIDFESVSDLENWVAECFGLSSPVRWEQEKHGPRKRWAAFDRLHDETSRSKQLARVLNQQLAARHRGSNVRLSQPEHVPVLEHMQVPLWPTTREKGGDL